MKKHVRRVIVFLLMITMILGFSNKELRAAETEDDGIHPTDVYIVLDNSYSMAGEEGSDPDRLAIQCADSFYTVSPANNSAIGILTFWAR